MNYEKIYKRAKIYAIKRRFTEEEAEDFAQNCAIKAFEINGPVNFEYMYLNHCDFERADKRILSGPQGAITGFRTISLDTPIDSSDSNSSCLDELIGDQRNDLGDRGEINEIRGTIEMIFNLIKNKRTKEWAEKTYLTWLSENAF